MQLFSWLVMLLEAEALTLKFCSHWMYGYPWTAWDLSMPFMAVGVVSWGFVWLKAEP